MFLSQCYYVYMTLKKRQRKLPDYQGDTLGLLNYEVLEKLIWKES